MKEDNQLKEACSRLMRVAAHVDPLVNRYEIEVKNSCLCHDKEILDKAIKLTMDLLYSEEYDIDISTSNNKTILKFKIK